MYPLRRWRNLPADLHSHDVTAFENLPPCMHSLGLSIAYGFSCNGEKHLTLSCLKEFALAEFLARFSPCSRVLKDLKLSLALKRVRQAGSQCLYKYRIDK